MVVLALCCCGCELYDDDFDAAELNDRYVFEPGDWERTGGAAPSARCTSNGGGPVKIFDGLANFLLQFRYTGAVGDTITIRAGTHLAWQIGPAVPAAAGHLEFPIYVNGYLSGSYTTGIGTDVEYNFYSALAKDTDDYVTLGELRATEGSAISIDQCFEFDDTVTWTWSIEATAGVGVSHITAIRFDEKCRIEKCNACTWARAGIAPSTIQADGFPDQSVRFWDAINNGYWTVPLPASCLFGNILPRGSDDLSPRGPWTAGSNSGFPGHLDGAFECAYHWRLSVADVDCEDASFDSLDGPEFDTTSAVQITSAILDVWVGTLTADNAVIPGAKGDVLVVTKAFIEFFIVDAFNGGALTYYGRTNTGKNDRGNGADKVVWADLEAYVPMVIDSPSSTLFPDITDGDSLGTVHVSVP